MPGWQVVTGAGDNWAPAGPSNAAIHSLLPHSSAGGTSTTHTQWPPVISTGIGLAPNRAGSLGRPSSPSSSLQGGLSTLLPFSDSAFGLHGLSDGQAAGLGVTPLQLPIPNPSLLRLSQAGSLGGLPLGAIPEGFPAACRPDHLLQQLVAARGMEQAATAASAAAAQAQAGAAAAAAAAAVAEQAAEGHSSGRSGGGHMDAASLRLAETGPPKREAGAAGGSAAPATSYRLRTRSASLREAWIEKAGEDEEEQEEEAAADDPGDASTSISADSEGKSPKALPRKGGKGRASMAGSGKAGAGQARTAAGKTRGTSKPAAGAAEAPAGAAADSHKRPGRPVAYNGDPDSPELTDAERRKLKRRIANRESARRVRAKRAELMDELQIKVTALGQQNSRLLSHAAVLENQRGLLVQQAGMLEQKLQQKVAENMSLFNQLYQLRKLLPPEVVVQAEQNAAEASMPPNSPMAAHGGGGGGNGLLVPVTRHNQGQLNAPHSHAHNEGMLSSSGLDHFSANTGMPQGLQFL